MPESEARGDCLTCLANRGEQMAPGGAIYRDALWCLEHALEPIPLAGWLVLKPLRHVESFAALSAEEAASFGPLVRRVTAAMTEVLAPAKVYLCLYAERDDAQHIHFHLIPRFDATPLERRGPGVFEYLREAGQRGENLAPVAEAERIARELRARLSDSHAN